MKEVVLDFNEKFTQALDLLENTDRNIYLTGRAGTGKSTLLNYFRNTTQKKVAILAPTGVAAVNVKGQTIHSFFRFKPNVTLLSIKKKKSQDTSKKNIYQKLDAIIIDEISMVRADLLDCIDKFLRLNGKDEHKPFGGLQIIFIGDLYQLPPIVTSQEREIFSSQYKTPYFFSARCFQDFEMEFLELEKVYRQKDADYLHLLNAIRNNTITTEDLDKLNRRYDPSFTPRNNDFYIYLTPTNAQAQLINDEQLAQLGSKLHTLEASVSGNFGREYFPTSLELNIKVDAQIMMLNNDASNRWINGTIGKITAIKQEDGQQVIVVKLENGRTYDIYPYTWEIYHYFLEDNHLQSSVVGTFTQYPLMLAWALTIHKSQGKTFEKVILDIGRGAFAHGQTYVALSRCISLEGLILKKPLSKKDIWMDYNVVRFITQYQYNQALVGFSLEEKIQMIQQSISNQNDLQIVYLKATDERTKRTIKPKRVGQLDYQGKSYIGVEAYCHQRQADRVFRIDRILEMTIAEYNV